MNKATFWKAKPSREFITLVALLLVFILLLVVIWLWYDIEIDKLEDEHRQYTVTATSGCDGFVPFL